MKPKPLSFMRNEPLAADDQVVQHVDVEQAAGLDDLARHLDVLGLGDGSPDGWLWTTTIAALLARMASRKTSPTRTAAALSEPM